MEAFTVTKISDPIFQMNRIRARAAVHVVTVHLDTRDLTDVEKNAVRADLGLQDQAPLPPAVEQDRILVMLSNVDHAVAIPLEKHDAALLRRALMESLDKLDAHPAYSDPLRVNHG